MPTVRYEIRNEFGLGGPRLYGDSATKDEPAAILEGVAMAGIVGLLRQLGDLAEFAADIFHELHKEVMVTATRGHRLMLRVQQVESEIPSIENAFLCQSHCTHFAYNMGINWHPRLHMDQNLIIRDGMPHFMMDAYEECHDPPQLSMLDKYDVTGVGACLRRYSNPTFFKTKLASSGIVESQAERENRVHKPKKKERWGNGENSGIISAPEFYSKLQYVMSSQASEELSVTHVKLNSRLSKGSYTTSYIEHLRQVLAPEENCASNNSKSYSSIMMKPIASENDQDRAERQRIRAEGLPRTLPMHEKCRECVVDNYSSNKLKIYSSDLPEIDQNETSPDDDWRTEGSSGSYRSDETSGDVDNYMDAQDTVEVETDSENNVKPNLSFTTVTRRMNSITDVPELQAQNSRVDFDETSNLVGFGTSCKTDESHDTVPGKWSNCEVEVDSFESLSFRGEHTAEVSPISPVSELAEELCNCSVADSPSLSPSGHSSTTESASIHWSGMSHESTEQVAEASQGRIDPPFVYSFPPISAMQTQRLDEATENLGSLEDDLVNVKPLSDVKELQEPNDLSSTKFIAPCSWKGDVCRPVKVHSLSKDAVHTDTVTLVEHSSIQNVVTEAVSDNHCPCLVILPAQSGSCACSIEERISESVVLDQNDSQIEKEPIPMNLTGTNAVCTPEILFTSIIEGQFSKSELHDSDFSHSDANVYNDCLHIILSKYAEKDLNLNNTKKDCTALYDIASEATPCCNEEIKREMVHSSHFLGTDAEPFEEALDQQAGSIPNLISFERYLSLKKDGSQNNPSGGFPKPSDSTCEPEYHGTENGVSFAEFLKLTQMDFLLNNTTDVSVDSLPSERVFRSKDSSKPSQNMKEILSLSPNPVSSQCVSQLHGNFFPSKSPDTPIMNPPGFGLSISDSNPEHSSRQQYCEPELIGLVVDNDFQETSDLPPLPPLEWRMVKSQIGHLTSNSNMAHSMGRDHEQCDPLSLERDSMQSVNLSRIHENVTLHLEESAAHIPDPSSDHSKVEDNNNPYIRQLSSSESKSSHHRSSSSEEDIEKTTGSFCLVSAQENECLQTEYETTGDLHIEDSSFNSDKPKKKLSLLHMPRDPLIEDVASHDKSTLRKVPEPIHPSVKPKADESTTLLEQIRNKSHNLKPASIIKPNFRGPPTNLKIAAILEKADAIRQACVGSDDDDDDGDGWSDS